MEFRLLGRLEVRDGGRELSLGGGKQRALLALLLLHAGEAVSTERLIDALWGEQPPASALNSVHVYVSQLRRALGDGRLVTRGRGYALELEEDELDLERFERLLAEGRELLAAGDARPAAERLRDALSLWRGPPLADFAYEPFAQTQIARLDALRLAALEERIEADLELGRHGELVPELEALVREHPLRERLRAQLMLALYRAGRQADALEAYRQARNTLDEELGLEPGPTLQELERAILRHDGELAAPERALVPRPVRRRAGLYLAAGGGVLLAAAAVTAVILLSSDSKPLTLVGADSVAVIDPATGRVHAAVGIADAPSRLASDGRSLWVGNDRGGAVSKVDERSYAVEHVVPTSEFPSDLAVGEGAVWVIEAKSGRLVKIDPVYGAVVARRTVLRAHAAYDKDREGLEPTSVAAGLGSVWLTDGTTKLKRIDPTTAIPAQPIETHLRLNAVATGGTRVWAISGPAATLIALDPAGRVQVRLAIVSRPGFESPYPLALAVGAGFVWILNGNTATVTKVDPRQRAIVATIPVGIEHLPVRLAAGEGAAWIANADGTLTRVDAQTDAVTAVTVARRLKDVAVTRGAIWVTTGSGLTNAAGTNEAEAPAGAAGRVRALPTTSCSPLYYRAGARPDVMIASDLPLQGLLRAGSGQVSQAVQFVLKQHGFRAGRYSVAYQSCDDSTARAGVPTEERCTANADAFARNHDVIAVLAPFNSFCTALELPIANLAAGGPLPLISFSNTAVTLTRDAGGSAPGNPSSYYPTGVRNFVRVLAADDYQGAANAILAAHLGAKRVYVAREPYLFDVGSNGFTTAATRLGLQVVGVSVYVPAAKTYTALAAEIRRSRADAVFVAGALSDHGDKVVQDFRAVLGPQVKILTPDGFTLPDAVRVLGSDAEGMTISVPGVPNERLPRRGREFVAAFEKAIGEPPLAYSVYAAQATEMLLQAIADSDGTRTSVRKNLFRARVTNGILGDFSISPSGDTTENAITIYRVERGKAVIFDVITPPARLVRRPRAAP